MVEEEYEDVDMEKRKRNRGREAELERQSVHEKTQLLNINTIQSSMERGLYQLLFVVLGIQVLQIRLGKRVQTPLSPLATITQLSHRISLLQAG